MAKRFDDKLEALRHGIDATKDGVASVKDSIGNSKIWALLLYIALAAVNLGTLARGLGWL